MKCEKENGVMINTELKHIIGELKNTILQSRYIAARLANSELLRLYFNTGKIISQKIKESEWGSKMIEQISSGLQAELPGLRGFSTGNLKKIRVFFNEWKTYIEIGSLPTNQLLNVDNKDITISSLITNQFYEQFYSLGFTHHYAIVSQTKNIEERIFYISQSAVHFWTVENLLLQIKTNLYNQIDKIPNNFATTLPENIGNKAVRMFKDEYLFDYINIEDHDDERVFEHAIMQNIKRFIMTLGNDFAFIGNQFRIVIDNEEFYIDLLFFNRKLQSLIAIELKRGKFKAEYAGKMNLYLSALDEYVKQPHENPSIGIILCKEKSNKVVEFSFKDYNKAMGVATYKTSREIPEQYKGILPNQDELIKLME